MRVVRAVVCGGVIAMAFSLGGPAALQAAEDEKPLQARVQALAADDSLGPHARGALEQAERALSRATEARAEGNAEAAARAERIARAALVLAERRAAQQQARRERAAAAHRLAELDEALARVRAGLGVERARLEALRAQFRAQKEASDAAR